MGLVNDFGTSRYQFRVRKDVGGKGVVDLTLAHYISNGSLPPFAFVLYLYVVRTCGKVL